MRTIDRLNDVIDYIEEHLQDEIKLDELSLIFASSKSVLQKTFLNICDMTISEYIRKRRLSEAAFDFRNQKKVVDVAVSYQYESLDAFTRAFKQQHGLTPSEAKQDDCVLTMFSRIVFTLTIKGAKAMNYRIENRGAMRIIGYKTFIKAEQAGTDVIPSLWDALTSEQCAVLTSKGNQLIEGIIGVNGEMHDGGFDYWIAVTSDEAELDGNGSFLIPASSWLKIIAEGPLRPIPLALKEAYQRFYNEWLPSSTYEHAGIAEIEYYPMMGYDPLAKDYRCELWVSIQHKREKEAANLV